jgi:predicted RNase H-like HicB family nuclease
MATHTYPAHLITAEGVFGVSVLFPDLEGCFSWGETPIEAVQNAREALELHLEALLEAGQPLPPATTDLTGRYAAEPGPRLPSG